MKHIVKLLNHYASGNRTAWFRTVTGINQDAKGAQYFHGEYLQPGKEYKLEEGTLFIGVFPEGAKSRGVDVPKLYRVSDQGELVLVYEGKSWRNEFHSFADAVEEALKQDAPPPASLDAEPEDSHEDEVHERYPEIYGLVRLLKAEGFGIISLEDAFGEVLVRFSTQTVAERCHDVAHAVTEGDGGAVLYVTHPKQKDKTDLLFISLTCDTEEPGYVIHDYQNEPVLDALSIKHQAAWEKAVPQLWPPVAQADPVELPHGFQALDALTSVHTVFTSFQNLLDAEGGYAPSLVCKGRSGSERDKRLLADMYDYAQALRKDPRRVFRS